MFTLSNLPEAMPLFPLEGAVLFPECRLPLRIFEPRYIAMIDDALKSDHRLIGMIQPKPGDEDGALYETGCAGRISIFAETEDDCYMIVLRGICRFRLGEQTAGFSPYLKGSPNWTPYGSDLDAEAADPQMQRDSFLKLVERYFELCGIKAKMEEYGTYPDSVLVNNVAMIGRFGTAEKQALLETETLPGRREALETLLTVETSGRSGNTLQ